MWLAQNGWIPVLDTCGTSHFDNKLPQEGRYNDKMHHISFQTNSMYEWHIVSIFILQIMSEMCIQYLIYPVLIHNSTIESCACIQVHTKHQDNYIKVHIMAYTLILLFLVYILSFRWSCQGYKCSTFEENCGIHR